MPVLTPEGDIILIPELTRVLLPRLFNLVSTGVVLLSNTYDNLANAVLISSVATGIELMELACSYPTNSAFAGCGKVTV